MTAPAIPDSPAGFENWLNDLDPLKLKASLESGEFQKQVKAYAENVHKADTSIRDQVAEQVQASMAKWMEESAQNPKSAPINFNPTNGRPNVSRRPGFGPNPKAWGAPLDGLFSDVTTFAQATYWNTRPDDDTRAKLGKIRDYQEKTPADGGFLVPEEFRSELFQLAYEAAIVRPRAQVVPMQTSTLRYPKVDETSRVSSLFGGIVVYRTEEGSTLTGSAAKFSSIKLEATKQTALATVTNELVRDWGGFDSFLRSAFPQALAYNEDYDFLTGNGAGLPLGALSSGNGALLVVNGETGQPASTIWYENSLHMYARMLPSSIGRSVWIASPDVFAELGTMALNVGTGGSAVWMPDAHGAPVLTLLGRPVIMTEKAPAALGTQGDLSLVDFGMYLLGDRQMMTIESSEHSKFDSDQTVYRMIARNDGRPWLEQAITPHNNSATLSPYVQLATR